MIRVDCRSSFATDIDIICFTGFGVYDIGGSAYTAHAALDSERYE